MSRQDFRTTQEELDQALLQACYDGDVDRVVRALTSGANINVSVTDSEDQNIVTPLHYAAVNKNPEVMKVLIRTGNIDPNPRDADGNTPLHHAAALGLTQNVEMLLGLNAIDSEAKNKKGTTPAGFARSKNHNDVLKALGEEPVPAAAVQNPEWDPAQRTSSGHNSLVQL